jgi:ATP-dependent metalloprotease FtsH
VAEFFDSSSSPGVLVFADKKFFSLCKKKVKSMNFHRAEKLDDAVEILKKHKIDLIMLDVNCGVNKDAIPSLNVEDVDSSAREFLKFIRERRSELPVYLMETEENIIGDEERVSFSRQGCRGVITLDKKGKFAEELDLIAYVMHQQGGMEKLAKANKAIFFETAQRVCEDGKVAEIRLFDFSLSTITSAEDSKKFTSSISMPDISFESVIGAEEAKRELLYFVDYLKNPNKFLGTGVKAPRGVIFYGPPGTGKTMLAKAMAKEAGVPFIAAEGNQFLKTYLGDGPESVHKLFRVARKYAPSIIFIDEIDAIGKARTGGSSSSSGVEATLTAFLAEMDGFSNDSSKPVFILAATNFDVEPGSPKSLDSALMRRFDRRILIDLPNKAERIRYLKMRVAKNPALEISEGQIENIATRATGTSLASLESAIELALRSAIREKSYKVTDALFEEAFETFTLGEIKHWDESQLERTARHEAGHTLLCWLGGETPSYLTIVPRGNYGGYMQRAEREGKAIYTREEILGRIRISLGGRATEIVYYGEDDGCSTGASGDLAKATELARRYVCEYGMDESFGIAVVGENSSVGGPVSVLVREAVNRILNEQMEQTVKIVSENKEKIDALVSKLLEKNHMNGSEIEKLLGEE